MHGNTGAVSRPSGLPVTRGEGYGVYLADAGGLHLAAAFTDACEAALAAGFPEYAPPAGLPGPPGGDFTTGGIRSCLTLEAGRRNEGRPLMDACTVAMPGSDPGEMSAGFLNPVAGTRVTGRVGGGRLT